ncbi:MAG: SusF/SusE family outer membrane protein [Bacteroidales bacterium]|jgi:hypothetical protein
MKIKSIFNMSAVLFAVAVFSVSCTKENSDVRIDPKLSTSQVLSVASDSATVVGFVVAQGSGFSERGVCYNTEANPTIENNKVMYVGDDAKATFNVVLSGLHYATTYYVKAYAINSSGVLYGEEYSFTTLPIAPALTTTAITALTGNSAVSGGSVTNNGGSAVTEKGVCYSESPNPTLGDTLTFFTSDGDGDSTFVSTLAGLKGNTKYYVRAYATNSAGTGYGPEVSFTTLVDLPAVSTAVATEITKVSAVSGGEVISDGGAEVIARGIVWSTNADPTLLDNNIAAGSGTGSFVSSITGLTTFTTYHVRAYATNSIGTAYGADVQFTTLANILTWYIPGDYVEASYPDTAYANWSPEKSPQVKSTVAAPDNLEGYVYMANTENNWKFASQPNWDGPNYGDDNNSGVLDPNAANNINSPSGYYKLNVDFAALTYTAVATVWGVIGDATPLGWDDETLLAYDPITMTWRGGMHLTAASYKFRANHNWDYNYGSDAGDGTLQAGGANISVTTEDDYYFILDLSNPNEYTYSANMWGVIGDATPGGWDSDQNMTWDEVDKAMAVTVDLTAGSFKFRANDDWAINLGGDINNLTEGGDNIPIEVAGNYTIKLYLDGTKHCVIVQN